MSKDDEDVLEDICPICQRPITDDDEWTLVNDVLHHVECVEGK